MLGREWQMLQIHRLLLFLPRDGEAHKDDDFIDADLKIPDHDYISGEAQNFK